MGWLFERGGGKMIHFNCPKKDSLRDSHAIEDKET
jgi:hypothetical protein